jgi:hypothetical protein
MLYTEDIDYPLEAAMELRETYPEEVLESGWNPVIAQIQLLKRRGQIQQQSSAQLWLTVAEAELPEH